LLLSGELDAELRLPDAAETIDDKDIPMDLRLILRKEETCKPLHFFVALYEMIDMRDFF
jgi:hypothetical protein